MTFHLSPRVLGNICPPVEQESWANFPIEIMGNYGSVPAQELGIKWTIDRLQKER